MKAEDRILSMGQSFTEFTGIRATPSLSQIAESSNAFQGGHGFFIKRSMARDEKVREVVMVPAAAVSELTMLRTIHGRHRLLKPMRTRNDSDRSCVKVCVRVCGTHEHGMR
ncbi:uncharacterized protein [Physcomitrium patens]|uniref:uncharacterized protein n=1 Tax=Physcomitrium patens TaxID=3218 RepID=UPI003CCDB62A